MKVSYPYLKDEKFLVLADTQRLQTQHIKLTLLDWDENPIQEIQGIATGGTISLNGSSAIRRTCNLNMTVDEIAETAITSVKNLISINKKLFLEIGIENKTRKYPEYPILWYPQGTFVFTSCNLSSGIGQGYTLSAQLKDKMCLLNGECGGTFTSSVELDRYDTLDPSTGEMYTTKNTISQIIRELVNHFGKIPLDKIIINDIDEKIKMTMRWSGDMPLYLAQKDSSYMYTTSYADAVAYGGNIKMFQYGEDCGFTITDFVYPSELIANIGDNICTILDKIKNALGNYEYYFDIDGNFIFQEIKNYLNTTQATVDLQNMSNNDYKIDIAKGKSIYDFTGAELITSYSNNPNYNNIKNDYVVWGIRENASKVKIPIRYHLAIDDKPQTGNIYRVYMYYDAEDGLLKARMPIGFDDKSHFPTIGNEDLLYWDKSTGFVYKWDVDKQIYVSPDGKQYSVYSDTDPGNSDTIYVDSTELQTGSGTNANLTNTAGNRKLSFKKYYGNTSQETTTGKNLLEINRSSNTSRGITTTYDFTTGKLHTSGTTTQSWPWLNEKTTLSIPSGTTITFSQKTKKSFGVAMRLYYNDSSYENCIISANTLSKTVTTTHNIIAFAMLLDRASNVSVNEDFYLQLEIGSSATSFEKFTYGASPNPDYPQEVEVVTGRNEIDIVGKNIFNYVDNLIPSNYGLTSVINNDGSITTTGVVSGNYRQIANQNITDILEDGQTYTISQENISNNLYLQLNVSRKDGGATKYWAINNLKSRSFTVDKSIYKNYVLIIQTNTSAIWGSESVTITNKYQLEKNTTYTDFEPYKKQSYEINLGKNLFDKENANVINAYISGSAKITSSDGDKIIYISCEPNTTYTIQKMLQATQSSNRFRVGTSSTIPQINDTLNQYYSGGDGSTVTKYTITTNSSAKYLCFFCYKTDTETTFDEMLSSIQIEKGNQATTYSPYFTPIELCKIGDYKDSIYYQASSKNLFDKNTAEYRTGYLKDDNGEEQTTGQSSYLSSYVAVKPNTQYTIQGTLRNTSSSASMFRLYYYDDSKTWISRTDGITQNPPYTFTTPNNCYYMQFQFITSIYDASTIQIEEGQATTYQPYGSGWYIKKNIGKVVLDGSESSWALHNSNANRNVYRITMTDKLPYTNNADTPKMFSNYFNPVPNNATWVIGNLSEGSSSSWVYFVVEPTYTLETFKTWLSTHNTDLYYVLANPAYTKITDETLIGQIEALENAITYDNVTNILQSNTDLPLTMNYTYYIKKEDSTSSKRYVWEVDPTSEHYTEIMNEINNVNEAYIEDIADEQAAIAALEEQIKSYNDALAALDITYKEGLTREKSLQRQISNLQNQTQTAAITAKILELQTELAALQAGDLAPYYTSKTDLESSISTAEVAIETNQAAIDAATATRDAAIAELTTNLGEYKTYTDNAFVTLKTTDWRSELYLSGVAAEALGLDQNYYYAELAAEWPKLYNFLADSYIDSETGQIIYTGDFTDDVKNNPWSVDYWLDFIDSESAIGGLSVDNIGRRSITKSSDDYNCVFESEIPDLVLIKEDTETTDKEREACEKRGQDYCQVESSIYDLLVSGGWVNSCFNEIKNLLWFNTSYNSSINLSLIPIYHLEPNTRITVQSVENDIHGDYMMNALSIPLTYNSTMSISGTQVQTKL